MKRGDFGVWEVTLPAKGGQPAIPHNSKVKVSYGGSVHGTYYVNLGT